MIKLLKYLTLAAAVAGFSMTVRATPWLALSSDGITWDVVAIDNGSGDINSDPGIVSYVNTWGGFKVNVDVGITYPAAGTLSVPSLDQSFNVTGTGDLYMLFSANGFGPTKGTAEAFFGGTINQGASISLLTFGGNSNNMDDLSNLLTSQGPFATHGGFSGDASGALINNEGPFSLTLEIKVLNSIGSSSGDAYLTVPDAGTTLLLLGAGLTGLALIGRRQKRAR